MTENRRLLELALKGLEAERQRIDDEMSDIHRQLGGRLSTAATTSAQPQRSAQGGQGQMRGNLTPAGRQKLSELMRRRWAAKRRAGGGSKPQASSAKKPQSGGNLTAAGRKKLSDLMRRRWAAKRRAKGGR
jgi:hypothetical protein